jgi:aspartyl-tRNA(Asn)/glutamyl-tRNA(Gln) amidotransferase subunit A
MAAGRLSPVALMDACLGPIAAREPDVQAFAWIEPARALAAARVLDAALATARGCIEVFPGVMEGLDVLFTPSASGEARGASHGSGIRPATPSARRCACPA